MNPQEKDQELKLKTETDEIALRNIVVAQILKMRTD